MTQMHDNKPPDMATSTWRYLMSAWRACDRERLEFLDSFRIAAQVAFRASEHDPVSLQTLYLLMQHNASLVSRAALANQEQLSRYLLDEGQQALSAYLNTLLGNKGESFQEYAKRQADIMEAVANFNEQIEKVKDDFGFQFRTADYRRIAETDSFILYQVLPLKEGVKVRDHLKPVLLVPPYMLGEHILAFLPYENKSYAHAFANAGIPTYVRVVKDIWETEAVQTMTTDDDCTQTHALCANLREKHGQKVTLNGTCQGGYVSLMNILSGTLTDVVDALISNVTPVDGTPSHAISSMPRMGYDFIESRLPNGNFVANGYLLSLGMRLVAIDQETPLIQLIKEARIYESSHLHPPKTVAALYRWLRRDRVHLPVAIAAMSSTTFQQPISKDGILPVKLFGKPLNIGDLKLLKVRWYQDYAVKDDLVSPPCALAGNRFVEESGLLESVPFPGGHVGILTSPYRKAAPVDGRFVGVDGKEHRGPVMFQVAISGENAPAS